MEKDVALPAEEISLPAGGLWSRLPVLSGTLGLLVLIVSALIWRDEAGRAQWIHSYLVAFLFFLSVALGGLFFVLLQHLTRAGWSVVVRRLAEHIAGTLPLFALLFVPIAFGLHDLFHWTEAGHDPLIEHKSPYLNATAFFLRAAFFLGSWSLLSWWFRKQSIVQDQEGGTAITRRMQTLSAPGMAVFGVTLTFASFDWIMSLDPHWYSTIFGVYFFAGCVVAIFASLILLTLRLQKDGTLRVVNEEHFHDMGKMLFGFVVFWAYIAFSQFMLIWYGNIPEETAWFDHRLLHGWKPVTIFLAVGHFVIPFLFLLSRAVKRRPGTLVLATCWLLFMHLVDLHWLVMPSFNEHFHLHVLDLLSVIGIGGLFLGTLGWLMQRRSLVPVGDPRLAESLAFENA